MEDRLSQLEARLARLELQSRFWRLAAVGLCFGVGVLLARPATSAAGDVQAPFRVMSRNGSPLLSVEEAGEDAVLLFRGPNNKVAVSMASRDGFGRANIYNNEGKVVSSLGASESGPGLFLVNSSGSPVVSLRGSDDGSSLELGNKSRRRIISLVAPEMGNAELEIGNHEDGASVDINASPTGAAIALAGVKGSKACAIMGTSAESGILAVLDKDGRSVYRF